MNARMACSPHWRGRWAKGTDKAELWHADFSVRGAAVRSNINRPLDRPLNGCEPRIADDKSLR
jgi:hypothetical protein